jgi:hypothetical protein
MDLMRIHHLNEYNAVVVAHVSTQSKEQSLMTDHMRIHHLNYARADLHFTFYFMLGGRGSRGHSEEVQLAAPQAGQVL